MKTIIAMAGAAAMVLALPAFAQQSTLPTPEERAQNRESVSSSAAAAALTTKVKSALAADVGLRTVTRIDVDSADGVVTLKGKVSSANEKRRAEQVAKKVDGVRVVRNQLRVEAEKKG